MTYMLSLFTFLGTFGALEAGYVHPSTPVERAHSPTALQVHGLFSDNMVLQTIHRKGSGPGILEGLAAPGDQVTLVSTGDMEFPGTPYNVTAGTDGSFVIQLQGDGAGEADGPYGLALSNQKETITANNVYFGEVFLCSGQVGRLNL